MHTACRCRAVALQGALTPSPAHAGPSAGELGRLAAVLDRLEPHFADVNAAGGAGAWEAGGGVYSAYLYLKVA